MRRMRVAGNWRVVMKLKALYSDDGATFAARDSVPGMDDGSMTETSVCAIEYISAVRGEKLRLVAPGATL